jgi:creatinine amidohydrolase
MIVTSSHGGNWILKPTIRELNMWDPDFMVMWGAPVGAGGSGPGKDRHSGESETSRLMYAYPELMRTEKVVDSSPDLGSEFVDMIPTEYYTPSGVWGFPTKADRDAGEERTRQGVQRQAEYIMETIEKLDEMRREHEQK